MHDELLMQHLQPSDASFVSLFDAKNLKKMFIHIMEIKCVAFFWVTAKL